MRSEASFQKQEQAFKTARTLADFANLEPEGVESFRAAHPDYVPPEWWSGRAWKDGVGMYRPWMAEQAVLRKAWAAGFSAAVTLRLVTTDLFLIAHALASDTTEEMETTPPKIWPYQRAILFLHVNPTKAKICEWCGKRFISETKARFCRFGVIVESENLSELTTCFWAHRQKYKNQKWVENSDSINEQRRREYRLEKKRSPRAKRKKKKAAAKT
jgi:hypothetical protein